MKRKSVLTLAALALSLVWSAGVLAQSSPTYNLTWNTVGAGGGRLASASYSLESAIGRPGAGTLTGSQFTLTGGFIVDHGAGSTTTYLPAILSQ
jgi:hypothetical protein